MNFGINHWLEQFLIDNFKLSQQGLLYPKMLILLGLLIVACVCIWWIGKKILHVIIPILTSKTKTLWDDIIFNSKVINSTAHLLPAIFLAYYAPDVFHDFKRLLPYIIGFTEIFMVVVVASILSSFFNSIREILSNSSRYRDKPIGSFTQLAKMIVYFIAGILIISILIHKNPLYLLTGLGAMAAILLLVFKDSILGFVASIQLSANDMIRVGDWVTVPKFGADGDVFEINLTTIKVQNFDKTITTIPTYFFISDSFTNWRGMENSDGRRIKRSIFLKIDGVKFCKPETINQFKKIDLIRPYVDQRENEIKIFNEQHKIDKSESINGRHFTNIGVFRAYITAYLKRNPNINNDMVCMVRQLAPTEIGVPLEIYAFSRIKSWVEYEVIVSDIFDHLLAAAHRFELEVFERPTGGDFRVK